VSYILDALKKAAEQRGAGAAVLLRPSAPLARAGRFGRLPWVVAGVLLAVNVAAVGYLLWPAPVVTPVSPPASPPKVALIQPVETPAPPPPTQVIPAERPRPAVAVEGPTAAPVKPPVPAMPVPPHAPSAKPPVEVARPSTGKPAVEKVPARAVPEATPAPAPAAIVPGAAAKADRQRFKLEVLSYSEAPAQRLVFINGRRYREGESLEGGVKVEEIREDSVVLSEAGQRFTLR